MGSYGFSFWALSVYASARVGLGSPWALVSSIFQAWVVYIPLLLIPQIAFGGLIVKVKDV